MILKSMGVECKKDDMDGYAGEVDEEATGKFTFLQFCQVGIDHHPDGGGDNDHKMFMCWWFSGEIDEKATGKFNLLNFCQAYQCSMITITMRI